MAFRNHNTSNGSNDAAPAARAFDPAEFGARSVPSIEFWKPDAAGETLAGFVQAFGEGRIGTDVTRHVIVAPAIIVRADGASAQGYESMKVGLNSVLKSRITDAFIGRNIAIRYTGREQTPAGPMRVFEVYEMTNDAMANLLRHFGIESL